MKPIDFLVEASEDYDHAFAWYASQSSQAARRFALAVDRALTQIRSDPQKWGRIDIRHHERRVNRFPFRLVYRIESNRIIIVAVAHAKRRPRYWRRRS